MEDDEALRHMINSIDAEMPTEGASPPSLESITPGVAGKTTVKRKPIKKVYVQKLITEIYVLTDIDGKSVSNLVNQEIYLLGNMSEAKVKRLIAADRAKHDEEI